jgi:hypothetical protein
VFRRGKRTLAMAPVVPLSTGNVALVTAVQEHDHRALPTQRSQDASAAVTEDTVGADHVSIGWSIRHPDGEVVRAHIATRAEASRILGSLAAHGAALPLVVYSPDGESIGEQLG